MNGPIQWSPGVTLDMIEKQVILKAYSHFRQNKTATSIALGISIRTLDNKFEKYEQEEKEEREKDDARKRKREADLVRARGTPPAQWDTAASPRSGTWDGMEPAKDPPAQSSVPLSKREEVQRVLPKPASGGHTRKLG